MLFLIHLIGGFYCATKLFTETDALTNLIMSVFVGWLFIVIYLIKIYLQSGTSSASNGGSKASSDTRHPYTADPYTEIYSSSNDDYEPDDQNSNYCPDNWSYKDLCDYYGCEEDDWPCD